VEGTKQPHHGDYVYAVKDEEAYLEADDEKQVGVRLDPASIICQFCGKSWQQVRGVFQASTSSEIPTPRPSRSCGSATSALPGWRRPWPRSPRELHGCWAGRSGQVAVRRGRRIGLAVPGRPIRSLVAEDRSAGGVRDQTGPNPDAHKVCSRDHPRAGETGQDALAR
jgi:hypothetical protein